MQIPLDTEAVFCYLLPNTSFSDEGVVSVPGGSGCMNDAFFCLYRNAETGGIL
jgi:hypothetical protein